LLVDRPQMAPASYPLSGPPTRHCLVGRQLSDTACERSARPGTSFPWWRFAVSSDRRRRADAGPSGHPLPRIASRYSRWSSKSDLDSGIPALSPFVLYSQSENRQELKPPSTPSLCRLRFRGPSTAIEGQGGQVHVFDRRRFVRVKALRPRNGPGPDLAQFAIFRAVLNSLDKSAPVAHPIAGWPNTTIFLSAFKIVRIDSRPPGSMRWGRCLI